MFRVPANAENPSFDDTFAVSTRRWLTSSAADRTEWARRRNAAAKTAKTNQDASVKVWADAKAAKFEDAVNDVADRAAKRLEQFGDAQLDKADAARTRLAEQRAETARRRTERR